MFFFPKILATTTTSRETDVNRPKSKPCVEGIIDNLSSIVSNVSGQIIATSHDLTPNGRVVGEPCLQWPYFREIQVGEIL